MIKDLIDIFGSRTKALEILYLLDDAKPVVRQGFYEEELEDIKGFCEKRKLCVETSPYKVVLVDGSYSNKGIKVKADDPRRGMFFVYISKSRDKAVMADVFEFKNDHRGLGKILGYPDCCIDFFVKNEPVRSRLDNDYVACTLGNSKGVRFPFQTNISKRTYDFTLLNHFPCSFNCQESIRLAEKHLSILGKHDPSLAMRFVKELKSRVAIGNKFVEFK